MDMYNYNMWMKNIKSKAKWKQNVVPHLNMGDRAGLPKPSDTRSSKSTADENEILEEWMVVDTDEDDVKGECDDYLALKTKQIHEPNFDENQTRT